MSADTTSTLGNWLSSSVLTGSILQNYFELPGLKATCFNIGDVSGKGGLTFEQPVWNPGSEAFAAHTEAGAITATSVSDDSFAVTVAMQVLDHVVTEESLFAIDGAGWMNFVAERAPWFAEQADNRISSMICAIYDDFTTVEGTAGDVLTVDDLLLARADLISADSGPGDAFAVIHGVQFTQLLNSLRAESMDGLLNQKTHAMGKFGAVKGSIMGITVVETSLVGTVSSNYRGALYRPAAIGYAHGQPKSRASWAPNARDMAVAEGEIAAYLRTAGVQVPEARLLRNMAIIGTNAAEPMLDVRVAPESSGSTREVRVGATLYCGVGFQAGKGIGLRSTT